MESADCVIIGAGIIGLACARSLAASGREVIILEAGDTWGHGISSRSSEVIHAGLYYPSGSLKAGLCRRGNRLLYAYCAERHIPHRRCGKWIVATDNSQIPFLQHLAQNAAASSIDDLALFTGTRMRTLEPELRCAAALLSPSTGIIDSHQLMLALLREAESFGAILVPRSTVDDGDFTNPDSAVLRIAGVSPFSLYAHTVINAAGLGAITLAQRFKGLNPETIPVLYPAKGCYFSYQGQTPFSRLVYPVPDNGGLGIHLTLDLTGQARFGPDIDYLDQNATDARCRALDYQVPDSKKSVFAAAIARYWPTVDTARLHPGYAGIRPKIHAEGTAAVDFRIDSYHTHGLSTLINLFGMESPGLTAALAIGEYIAEICASLPGAPLR